MVFIVVFFDHEYFWKLITGFNVTFAGATDNYMSTNLSGN